MSNYDKPQRKRYIPPQDGLIGRTITISKDTNVTDVISSALAIIKQQVDTLSVRSSMGGTLDVDQVKSLRTYVQSLVELSREDRERTKHEGVEEYLANLSVEELVKLAQGKVGEVISNSNALDTKSTSVPSEERSNEDK